MAGIWDILGAGGQVLGGVGSLVSGIGNIAIGEKNLALEKEQFQYSKDLQQTMFGREDTAIQRRVADLKAAGLNPVLAAGQGAQAGPVVSTRAPQRAMLENPVGGIPDVVTGVLNMIQAKKNIDMTDMQMLINREKWRQENATANMMQRDDSLLRESDLLSTSPSDVKGMQSLLQQAFPGLSPQGQAIIQLLFKMVGGATPNISINKKIK